METAGDRDPSGGQGDGRREAAGTPNAGQGLQ